MIHKVKHHYQRKVKQNRAKRRVSPQDNFAFDHTQIAWIALEDEAHERGMIWKILMSITVAVTVIWSFFIGAWTFGIAILTFVIVYYLNHEHPDAVEVKISEIGIKVGERCYPYQKIKAFWIHYEAPYEKTLNIRVHGDISNDIAIQLNQQDPAEVREYLIDKVPEVEGKQIPFINHLLRFLKI